MDFFGEQPTVSAYKYLLNVIMHFYSAQSAELTLFLCFIMLCIIHILQIFKLLCKFV